MCSIVMAINCQCEHQFKGILYPISSQEATNVDFEFYNCKQCTNQAYVMDLFFHP